MKKTYEDVPAIVKGIDSGEMQRQKARKWYISPWSTETEIVETAFKAARASNDHVLKEHFTYQGRRIYSPHFHVAGRLLLCDEQMFDRRSGTRGRRLFANCARHSRADAGRQTSNRRSLTARETTSARVGRVRSDVSRTR